MSLSTRVKVTAYSVMVAYAIALYAYGITLPDAATRTLGLIPTGVVALFALVDNWLWAKRPFLFLMGQPLLKGTWYGELTSYRRDDAAPSDPVTKPVVLVIGQTLTTLHLTLMTGESKSRSGAAHILKKHTNDYVVQYQYQNEPRMEFRDRGSTIHSGGSTIEVSGLRPTCMEGEYWTARDTRGTYTLRKISAKQVDSFDKGRELEGGGRP